MSPRLDPLDGGFSFDAYRSEGRLESRAVKNPSAGNLSILPPWQLMTPSTKGAAPFEGQAQVSAPQLSSPLESKSESHFGELPHGDIVQSHTRSPFAPVRRRAEFP